MIRHLCNRIPSREWSGVLFYTVTGSFEEGLTVECQDICLMDVGSAAYTEFDTSPDIAGYMVEHNLLDCYMGLIHSHNTMSCFFSSTDTSTLQEEGSYKNNFVSLIVNNAGSYTAAITRHIYSEVENDISYTYEMFGDGSKTGKLHTNEKKEFIEYFMLDVHRPEIVQNTLDVRIDEILEKKKQSASKSVFSSNQTSVRNDRTSYDTVYSDSYYKDEKDVQKRHKPMDIPWHEEEFRSSTLIIPRKDINETALRITMARLLTGSITCNTSKVDIDSWVSNYDKVYASKFADLVDYSEWLAPYMEYLMYHIPGVSTDVIDDVVTALYADAIIKKIGSPNGQFSKELIDQLRFYGSE